MDAPSETVLDDLYRKLVDEEDARVCKDISDEACRETPASFFLTLLSRVLSKLGDALTSPKTVLAWVSSGIGVAPGIIAFLVPIRESGSMLPQLVIAGFVRRLPIRKWVWVAGSVVQGLCAVGLGLVALRLEGRTAGLAVLALVIAFSLARGFCSVAAKDVLGKTVPKTRRGRLNGWSASAAGLVSVGVGALFATTELRDGSPGTLAWLLIGAGGLWALAALVFSGVKELPGETEGGASALKEAVARLSILRDDAPFRRFVISRALLMCSALSAPFYTALAQETGGAGLGALGAIVAASGLADLLTGPVVGRLADRSSRQVMVLGGSIAAGMGAIVCAVSWSVPEVVGSLWFLPVAYFVLSVAHGAVRVGRKTYVVDLASGNKRTDYVAVGNTTIGLLLLVVGGLGAALASISSEAVIAVLAVMGLGGAALSAALPEVTQPEDTD